MMTYRGYDIEGAAETGYTWTDEAGVTHRFDTEELAMDAIDRHRRARTIGAQ